MTSEFLNGWKGVCRTLGQIYGDLTLVFALTASKPGHRWDQGIMGNMGSSILGRESWPAGVQWRLRTPSLLPEMVSDFDSLHKPVTLDESQPGSSGCGELEDASRARH